MDAGKFVCVALYRAIVMLTLRNSLETLPFATDHFDFVRCVRIGFHVPEDEVRG